MKTIFLLIKNNLFLTTYILLLSILPLTCSSYLAIQFVKFDWFFQSLKPLDVALIFFIFSFTMALAVTPTTFICLASGYLWGWSALPYLVPSYLLAQTMGYYLAKLVNRDRLQSSLLQIKGASVFFNNVHQNQPLLVFLARISPVLPFAIMNAVLSALKVNFFTFSWAGLVGMLPRTLYFLWAGQSIKDIIQNPDQNWVSKGLIIIVSLISIVLIFRLISKQQKTL